MSYFTAIKTACFLFPIIAFLFTIPFILYQYHRYGSVHKLRCLIIYSFIFYLLTIYFLVILPLPNPDTLTYRSDMIRFIPGGFILDIIKESSLVFTNPKTYFTILESPALYTTILNIVMTVPFGMYLRYYFRCDLKKVIWFSFLLSLFFELTQLSRLYFIYKYQYRVFDVDDLFMNTLGGIIGYFVVAIFMKFLPSREQLDYDSMKEGRMVSGYKRVMLFLLDFLCFQFLAFPFKNRFIKFLLFLFYYGMMPSYMEGQTVMGKFLHVRFCTFDKLNLKIFLRQLFVYGYYFLLPFWILGGRLFIFGIKGILRKYLVLSFLLLLFVSYMVSIKKVLKNEKTFYDWLFGIRIESTIRE